MQPTDRVDYACGVTAVCTDGSTAASFWQELKDLSACGRFSYALLFFSKSHFDPQSIAGGMRETCPDLPYAACSTAGEITQFGIGEGRMVAVLFPADSFVVEAVRICDIRSSGMEKIVKQVSSAKLAFLERIGATAANSTFALCLVDGMSFAEEAVTAALHWGLDEIPLLGGSAGDDMNFVSTTLMLDGETGSDCAILLLVNTSVPFQVFKTDNFVPTADKLVVTRSDPERRIVYEFNAAPAAEEYAKIINIGSDSLSPLSFASHPLVVRVGGEYYCRSVQKMNEDGSLSFFCAIDDGVVLTVAEPAGMARTTLASIDAVREKVGAIDFILGFDCVLRRIDARNRQVTHKISKIYQDNNVIGFNTYGEQYLSMHLNQTFTGIAFGVREAAE